MVETSPQIITTFPNMLFKVDCNVRAESAGKPMNTTIEWTRISPSSNNTLQKYECTPESPYCSNTSSNEHHSGNDISGAGSYRYHNITADYHYHNILIMTENYTVGVIIYRCIVTTQSITIFSDTTILLKSSI